MSTPEEQQRLGGVIHEPDNYKRPSYPRWLTDRWPYKSEPSRDGNGPGRTHGNIPNLRKVVTGTTLLGLLYGIDHWARPTLKTTVGRNSTGRFVPTLWIYSLVLRLIQPRLRYIAHHVSHGAIHTEAAPATMIQALAKRWEQTTWNLVYLAHDLSIVIPRLVHHTVPRAVRVKTVPLVIRTRKLQIGLIRLRGRVATMQTQLRTLQRLRIKSRLRRLEGRVYHRIPLQIGRATARATRAERAAHEAQREARRSRWTWAFAGAVPLFYYMLRKTGNNWIRCRRVQRFNRRICHTDDQALNDLFGLLALMFGPFSVVEFTNEMRSLESLAVSALREAITEL